MVEWDWFRCSRLFLSRSSLLYWSGWGMSVLQNKFLVAFLLSNSTQFHMTGLQICLRMIFHPYNVYEIVISNMHRTLLTFVRCILYHIWDYVLKLYDTAIKYLEKCLCFISWFIICKSSHFSSAFWCPGCSKYQCSLTIGHSNGSYKAPTGMFNSWSLQGIAHLKLLTGLLSTIYFLIFSKRTFWFYFSAPPIG